MAVKKNFVLRIDEEVYKVLEKWAADEFRSVNGQIESIIHEKLKESARLPKNNTLTSKEQRKKT